MTNCYVIIVSSKFVCSAEENDVSSRQIDRHHDEALKHVYKDIQLPKVEYLTIPLGGGVGRCTIADLHYLLEVVYVRILFPSHTTF